MTGPFEHNGIRFNNVTYSTVKNCRIERFAWGIDLRESNGNTIIDNVIRNNSLYPMPIGSGIAMMRSEDNVIAGNTVSYNSGGIEADGSVNITIMYNTIEDNPQSGVLLVSTNYSKIQHNSIHNTTEGGGLFIEFSYNNTFYSNVIVNGDEGIYFLQSGNNEVRWNRACGNWRDIWDNDPVKNSTGDDNICNYTVDWQDPGQDYCKYDCGTPTTTTLPITTTTMMCFAQTTSTIAPSSTTTTSTSTTTTQGNCTLPGDYPPCDEISIQEIIDMINEWLAGRASLGEVIDLINAWATG